MNAKTLSVTIESPSAIRSFGIQGKFIALPTDGVDLQMFSDFVCEQSGEGNFISERDGEVILELLVENDYQPELPLGAWIVRYSRSDWDGATVLNVWMAAKVKTT